MPLVKIMIVVFGVVAWPLGKFLDWLLGEHHENKRFQRKDLKAIIELHQHSAANPQVTAGGLSTQEVSLINTIIDLRDNTVRSIGQPMEKVFALSCSDRLSAALLDKIVQKGYSRIVVHRGHNKHDLLGTVRMKDLLTVQDSNQTVQDALQIQKALVVYRDTNLLKCLLTLQSQKAALCLVADQDCPATDVIFNSTLHQKVKLLRLVSLKDLYEALLKKELKDDDQHLSLGSQRIVRHFQSREHTYNVQPRSMANIQIQKKHFKNINRIQEEH